VLVSEGLVNDIKDGVKILGNGEITKQVTVKAHAFSSSAKEKIQKAQGNIELIK
jgi:large subunit ribosomal protein L15